MPLNKAQLLSPPGGPGVIGAVSAGTGISITPQGVVSVNPAQNVTKLVGSGGVTVDPPSGVGVVTVTAAIPSGGSIPSGGKTLFVQAAAPAGWTQITTDNNVALRLVNTATGGQTGGSLDFTAVFASVPISGSVTLGSVSLSSANTNTVTLTPSGSVSLSGLSVGSTAISAGQSAGSSGSFGSNVGTAGLFNFANGNFSTGGGTSSAGANGGNKYTTMNFNNGGGGQGHTHSASGSANFSGSSNNHSHTVSGSVTNSGANFTGNPINLAVKYVNVIACLKN